MPRGLRTSACQTGLKCAYPPRGRTVFRAAAAHDPPRGRRADADTRQSRVTVTHRCGEPRADTRPYGNEQFVVVAGGRRLLHRIESARVEHRARARVDGQRIRVDERTGRRSIQPTR